MSPHFYLKKRQNLQKYEQWGAKKEGNDEGASLVLPSPLLRALPVKAIADSFDRLPVQVGALVMVMKFLVH